MPHLMLEYSTNIIEEIRPKELFAPCHRILVETANADPNYCQSRAIPCDSFYIGTGNPKEALIYLEILLLIGRSPSTLDHLQKQIGDVLRQYFARSIEELHTQIGIHVVELSPSRYFTIKPLAT